MSRVPGHRHTVSGLSGRPASTGRAESVAAIAAILVCMVVIAAGWLVIGPGNPVFLLVVVFAVFGLAAFTGPVWDRLGPERSMMVSDGVIRRLRLMGVAAFGTFLDSTGWRVRPRLESRDQVRILARETTRSYGAHAFGASVHIAVGLIMLGTGSTWSAVWLLISAVPLHVYPALLQLPVYRRIARLRARLADS